MSTQFQRTLNALKPAQKDSGKEEQLPAWPYPEGYPSDPPKLELKLSMSKANYFPSELPEMQVLIHNQTLYPVTLAATFSILRPAQWRNAYERDEPMITVTAADGKPIPHYYRCVGYEFYRTCDYEDSFVTIEAGATYTVTDSLSTDDLEPGQTYSACVREPNLEWWAYGRKDEILAPGSEVCDMIYNKTGKYPLEDFDVRVEPRGQKLIITSSCDPVTFHILEVGKDKK